MTAPLLDPNLLVRRMFGLNARATGSARFGGSLLPVGDRMREPGGLASKGESSLG